MTNYAYGVIKFFVLCQYESGEFQANIETTETAFFDENEIPDNLATEKSSREQIEMCFDAYHNRSVMTLFD